MSVDVVTLGETLLRLSLPPGTRFRGLGGLTTSIGGAESNVAVALAQMGCAVAWVSAVPDNDLGHHVLAQLGSLGVDTQFVHILPGSRLGIYFVEPGSAPRPTRVIYDRKEAAVTRLESSDVPWEVIESAKAVHITGITPALSDSLRELSIEFTRRARSSNVSVCVDVNYRSHLWAVEEAKPILLELCQGATLAILTEEDARDVFGFEGPPRDLVRKARDTFAAQYVALTVGSRGALLCDAKGIVEQPGVEAAVVDRIGCGDAFAAGLVLGVVKGDVAGYLPTAVGMAALKLGIRGDHFSGSQVDIDGILAGDRREVNR